MPKVKITNSAGLVQEKGSGGLKVVHAGISGSAGVEGIRLAAGGSSGFLHIVQGEATIADSTVTTDITDLVPAGSQVLCGKVEMTTASSQTFNITDVGTANDNDIFSGDIAMAAGGLNSQVLAPIGLMPLADDNSDGAVDVRVTHASSGAQATDGVVRVTLLVATAATTEG